MWRDRPSQNAHTIEDTAVEVAARGAVTGATPTFRDGEAENRVNIADEVDALAETFGTGASNGTLSVRAEVSRAAGHVTF